MAKRTYENDKIKVYWDSEKCIHSANCINGLPAVFNNENKPWINIDAASAEDIKRVIDTCPTGALLYEVGGKAETVTCIRVLKNGPYRVTGSVKIIKADGTELPMEGCYTLCRCGQSKKMPYCDGTHVKIKFTDKE